MASINSLHKLNLRSHRQRIFLGGATTMHSNTTYTIKNTPPNNPSPRTYGVSKDFIRYVQHIYSLYITNKKLSIIDNSNSKNFRLRKARLKPKCFINIHLCACNVLKWHFHAAPFDAIYIK